MSMFNVVFAFAVLIAVANFLSIVAYVRAIKYSQGLAAMPPIREALKTNKHYEQSVAVSSREMQKFGGIWFGVSQAAILSLVITWVFGALNGGNLSDMDVLSATIALTAVIARPLVAPISSAWLVPWIVGLRAVLVACHKQALEARIEEIMACDDAASDPMAYIELEMLYGELNRINAAIGTQPESQQSEKTE